MTDKKNFEVLVSFEERVTSQAYLLVAATSEEVAIALLNESFKNLPEFKIEQIQESPFDLSDIETNAESVEEYEFSALDTPVPTKLN